jgi:hypothetical protein
MQALLDEVGLKEQVGNLVADNDFKDENYEEGIDFILGKLTEKHKRLEQMNTEKQIMQKK